MLDIVRIINAVPIILPFSFLFSMYSLIIIFSNPNFAIERKNVTIDIP